MIRSSAALAGLAAALVIAPAAFAQPKSEAARPAPFMLRPAKAPVPALKYELLTDRSALVPGNAAVFYHRAIEIHQETDRARRPGEAKNDPATDEQALAGWLSGPLHSIPHERAGQMLDRYRMVLFEIKLAVQRRTCDWELDSRTEGVDLLIPEIQNMRAIVRLVCLQARVAVLEGKTDEALDWIKTGLTMARHVSDGPGIIQSLVGISLASVMLKPLEDVIQAPGSPNLYWALAGRPRPFIDISAGIESERLFLEREIPQLRELGGEPWSLEKARAFTAAVEDKLIKLLGHAGGKTTQSSSELAKWTHDLGIAGMVAQVYPEAKRALIDQGRPARAVAAMPVVQVAMLHTFQLYRQLRDDVLKWARLPYYQGYEAMNEQLRRTFSCSTNNMLLRVFVAQLPAIHSPCMAGVLLERKLDAIQCIEAIRLYAAEHGKLPVRLDQIAEAPTPIDAGTGQPFAYHLRGETADLSARPSRRARHSAVQDSLRAEIDPLIHSDKETTTMVAYANLFLLLAVAQPPTEPAAAARVKAIAQFVEPDVFAVVQLDLKRVDSPELAARLTGAAPAEAAETVNRGLEWARGLRKAGGKEVYFVFSLASMPGQPYLIVVPQEGVDPDAISRQVLGAAKVPAGGSGPTAATVNGVAFIGPPAVVERVRKGPAADRPELAAAWGAIKGDAVDVRVLILPSADSRRVLEEMVPNVPAELGGGPITEITRGLLWAAAGLDLGREPSLRIAVQSQDENAAKGFEQFANKVLDFAAHSPDVVKRIPELPKLTADIKPTVAGNRVSLDIDGKKAAALIEAVSRPMREDASFAQCVNNEKQIALAIHNYISQTGDNSLPPAFTVDKAGKPLLSWRVLVLPYLEQQALFEEFHLDEPWDSPHNKPLIAKMPAVYRCPAEKAELAREGKTRYVSPRGDGTIFRGAQPTKLTDITDGTSNTIMLVDAGDDRAVIWTKPDDWQVEPELDVRGLFTAHGRGGTNIGFADGSVRFLSELINPIIFKALLTRAGGEIIGPDDLK